MLAATVRAVVLYGAVWAVAAAVAAARATAATATLRP